MKIAVLVQIMYWFSNVGKLSFTSLIVVGNYKNLLVKTEFILTLLKITDLKEIILTAFMFQER